MLYSTIILVLVPFLLAVTARPGPARIRQQLSLPPVEPVQWLSTFSTVPADTDLHLRWDGGDGRGWGVYYIPMWQGQLEYAPVDIASNTTSNSLIWRTPSLSTYPEGTTFILGVNDGSKSLSAKWYDVTGPLDFVEPETKVVKSRKGWIWTL